MAAEEPTQASRDEQLSSRLRQAMVADQLVRRGIRDPLLLQAMASIPRELFIPAKFRDQAYEDRPLPIADHQTISQPYIVAYMIEQLRLTGREKVLEIGTGSGYQTAILSRLSKSLYTIEISPRLAVQARKCIETNQLGSPHFRVGNGYLGWPEEPPFDAIVVSAAPHRLPRRLLTQLSEGGRMSIPIGRFSQFLYLITHGSRSDGIERKMAVRFVPMTGRRIF